MRIFYDGLDIEKYAKYPIVEGFTTNCTFFSKVSDTHDQPIDLVVKEAFSPPCQMCKNYTEFYNNYKELISGRSISLQTWEHGDQGIEQIDAIHAINKDIFITIPIINNNNDINEKMLTYAVSNNMRINITAIYTYTQLNIAHECLLKTTNDAIVSVCAGGISDTGTDPSMIMSHAKRLFKNMSNVQILWEGCRELYYITHAEELDCDIIAVSGDILDKIHLLYTDLNKMSVDMVDKLRNDAIRGGITI